MSCRLAEHNPVKPGNGEKSEQAATAIRRLIGMAEDSRLSGSVSVRVTVQDGKARTIRTIYERDND